MKTLYKQAKPSQANAIVVKFHIAVVMFHYFLFIFCFYFHFYLSVQNAKRWIARHLEFLSDHKLELCSGLATTLHICYWYECSMYNLQQKKGKLLDSILLKTCSKIHNHIWLEKLINKYSENDLYVFGREWLKYEHIYWLAIVIFIEKKKVRFWFGHLSF